MTKDGKKAKVGLTIAALVGLGLWAWSKRKPAEAVALPPGVAPPLTPAPAILVYTCPYPEEHEVIPTVITPEELVVHIATLHSGLPIVIPEPVWGPVPVPEPVPTPVPGPTAVFSKMVFEPTTVAVGGQVKVKVTAIAVRGTAAPVTWTARGLYKEGYAMIARSSTTTVHFSGTEDILTHTFDGLNWPGVLDVTVDGLSGSVKVG